MHNFCKVLCCLPDCENYKKFIHGMGIEEIVINTDYIYSYILLCVLTHRCVYETKIR